MPRLAAIVLNYNYGRYLGACLESIDQQTHRDIRVIVIDDCSTDDSRHVIEAWSALTPHAHDIVWKDKNRGPAHSYNVAREMLRPDDEFAAFIDADDLWLPQKVAQQLAAFTADDVVVYSDALEMDDETGQRTLRRAGVVGDQPPLARLLSRGAFFALNAAVIRSAAVERVDETMRLCDLQLWLAAARSGRFRYVQDEVAVVRVHGSSMSHIEGLYGDRLRLLARHSHDRIERAWARTRGRKLLNAALVGSVRPAATVFIEYGRGTRDPLAIPYLVAAKLPGSRALARRFLPS